MHQHHRAVPPREPSCAVAPDAPLDAVKVVAMTADQTVRYRVVVAASLAERGLQRDDVHLCQRVARSPLKNCLGAIHPIEFGSVHDAGWKVGVSPVVMRARTLSESDPRQQGHRRGTEGRQVRRHPGAPCGNAKRQRSGITVNPVSRSTRHQNQPGSRLIGVPEPPVRSSPKVKFQDGAS